MRYSARKAAVREARTLKLVERDAERHRLGSALDGVIAGSGAAVMLVGPAGIGKTRLLQEAEALAMGRGIDVLLARCSETEQAISFGAVRQLLEPSIVQVPPEEQAALLGGAAAPARRALDAAPAHGGTPDRDGEPGAALHGLYRLIVRLCERQPRLLIVDDAHWADHVSLAWLAYLAPRLGGLSCGLLLAIRSADPHRDPRQLAELVAAPEAEALELRELSAAGSAALVRELLDGGADDEFCAACHRATGGNPFLLHELVSALRSDGVAPVASGADRVREIAPARIEHAVKLRLAHLGLPASKLAQAISVLGECELAQAAALAGLEREAAIEAADELTAADVLAESRPLRFTHPLVRGAAYAGIPARTRAAMHLAAARIVWEGAGSSERVVSHLLRSDPAGEDWVVSALRHGATDAAARGDLETATALLRRALAEPPSDRERTTILLELGTLEARMREPEAAEHLRRALADADRPEDRTRAALELHRLLAAAFRWREAAEPIDGTAAQLRNARPDLARTLEVELIANSRLNPSTRPSALARMERLRIPERPESAADRLLLAVAAHEAELACEPAGRVVELARRALAEGALLAEHGPDAPSMYYAAQALAAADELDEADRHYGAALEEARQRGSVLGFALVSCFRSGSALRRGALPAAESEARAAIEATDESGWGTGMPAAAAFLVAALIQAGKLEQAQATLHAHGLDSADAPDTIVANHLLLNRGRLRVAQGDVRQGSRDLLAFGGRATEWGMRNPAAFPWRSDAAHALAALGEARAARRLADEELELARKFGAARAVGIALRAAAATRSGRVRLGLLREAVDTLEPSPARLDLARALCDLGATLRGAGDAKPAREPLRRALDLAHRCGATSLAERARSELRSAGGKPRRLALTGRDALTPGERRVCEMASEGMMNREIAEALFVTVPTIESHLRNAYQKLGISSREGLAQALEEPGGRAR